MESSPKYQIFEISPENFIASHVKFHLWNLNFKLKFQFDKRRILFTIWAELSENVKEQYSSLSSKITLWKYGNIWMFIRRLSSASQEEKISEWTKLEIIFEFENEQILEETWPNNLICKNTCI